MAEMKATYASPGLRYAVFLEDYPGAPQVKYGMATGDELNIPPIFRVDETAIQPKDGPPVLVENFVTATLAYPPGDPHQPIVGWKEVPAREKNFGSWAVFELTPENYEKLCTKALGRALKRAGYPGDTVELKALMHWRERSAEVEAISAGRMPMAALPSATRTDDPMGEAGRQPGDDNDDEHGDEPTTLPDNAGPITTPPPGGGTPPRGGKSTIERQAAELASILAEFPSIAEPVNAFITERGWIGRERTENEQKTLAAFIASQKRNNRLEDKAAEAAETGTAPTTQPTLDEAPTASQGPQSGGPEPRLGVPTGQACEFCNEPILSDDSVVWETDPADATVQIAFHGDGECAEEREAAKKAGAPV